MRDYHKILRRKIEAFRSQLIGKDLDSFESRVTVDSAPILEKAMAAKTQKGFIGKNTLYIHPEYGSFLLLGELLVNKDLDCDEPAAIDPSVRKNNGGCGSCRRCQVWCPTGALDQDYRMDARRCLSYLTIEHRGLIPVEYWKWLEYYFFGCDICQLACPWNRKVEGQLPVKERKFIEKLDPVAILKMSQQEYEIWFGGTPVTRAKRVGLKRNALIFLVVTKHKDLDDCIEFVKNEGFLLLQETLLQIPNYLLHRDSETEV